MSWDKKVEEFKREICKLLMRIDALKFGTFTLTSGGTSSYYIDLRLIPSHPVAFQRVTDIYAEMARNMIGLDKFTRIAGIPTAGMPFSSVLALKLGKPFLYVRRETKPYGRERRIEGVLMPGDKVLIVDDLITTGKSIIDTVDALRAEGAIVKDALVLIDREEGGKRALAEKGVKLHYLVGIREAAKILYEMNAIDEEQLKAILRQVKAR